jgi:polysaccharide biosynthesis protein PslJ
VAGGFLGTYFPRFAFSSPLETMISPGLRSDPYISALIHPNAAQLQAVLGGESGRAAAPWGYTNYWANNFSLLLIWFVVGWGICTAPRRQVTCWLLVAASLVPVVYSLNRGLWIGLAFTVLVIAVRLLLRGKILVLAGVAAVVAIGTGVFAFTPLRDVYGSRLQHPASNAIRLFLTKAAINGANESPVLGWGGTRRTVGSNRSITIGRTPDCPLCGQFAIGSNGQLWTVLFNQGYVGAAFFLGFFGMTVWTYRRDKSVVSQAGVIAVALTFVYMLFYSSLPSALTITMISVALLWRVRLDQHAPGIPSVARAW